MSKPANPYRVLGPEIPAMMGRESVIRSIERHLDKPQPDHVSVLGPALYGKSVVLKELERRYAKGRPGYLTAVHVDLRRATPTNDEELRVRLAEAFAEAFQDTWPEGAELLAFEDVELVERLHLVGRELAKTPDAVLTILDGLDEVLTHPGITRGIWDSLIEISAEPVLRFVTGSREPLRELGRTEEARAADFWQIFHDAPVIVGSFGDEDWPGLLRPLGEKGIKVDLAARQALTRWTGDIPVLVVALLESMWRDFEEDESVTAQKVDKMAERLLVRRRQLLLALWDECSAEMKSDLADLTQRSLKISQVPAGRLVRLERRGLVRRQGKRLALASVFMERTASQEASGLGGLQRLFGDPELFSQNVGTLLELRLAQTPVVDKALRGYVEQAIRSVQPDPRHTLVWVRSIVDRALDLVWFRELEDGRTIPKTWLEEWKRAGFQRLPDDGHGRVPRERGRQLGTLRFATGTGVRGHSIRRLTRFITQPTALLLDHLHEVGNFGQHQGDPVQQPFSVAVCLSSIALCENLAHDLGLAEASEAE